MITRILITTTNNKLITNTNDNVNNDNNNEHNDHTRPRAPLWTPTS